jgi:hypothetical protein
MKVKAAMLIDSRVFWILEYQTIDSLGRGKEWKYAGIGGDEQQVAQREVEIRQSLAGKDVAFRAHRYSHQLGKNA